MKNYDNWKIATPYENEVPELFETEKYNLFSTNEDDVQNFNDRIEEISKEYDKDSYNSYNEFFQEYIENLQDEFNLSSDQVGALEIAEQNYYDEKEFALEQKYQQMKDDRNE